MAHKRNKHQSQYDLKKMVQCEPALKSHLIKNKFGNLSIDFSNSESVKILNKSLLSLYYGLKNWNIPEGYLCPPIPGRADYIHSLADLLASTNKGVIPKGASIKGIDIGTGASCIYPLIGHFEYGWNFLATDIDPVSLKSSNKILTDGVLDKVILLKLQIDKNFLLKGVIEKDDYYHFTICNPPFHASLEDAKKASGMKWRNLGKAPSSPLNFGGSVHELFCDGGEVSFILKHIDESKVFQKNVGWFTSLVSRAENLEPLYRHLKKLNIKNVKTIEMSQGNKISRILAWSYIF